MTIETHSVPLRPLPGTGLELPALSLGSWHIFDRIRFQDGVGLIKRAMDLGINHFDVGVYDRMEPGFTDIIFGALVRVAGLRRDDYRLTFKLWLSDLERPLRAQLETALLRANVDFIDLAMLGEIPDARVARLPELVAEIDELRAAGLIRGWGINNWAAQLVHQAMDAAAELHVAGPVMAQLKYSVSRRAIADGAPYTELYRRGLALETSDVLEGGILAGRPSPERPIGKDPGDIRAAIVASLPAHIATAERRGLTPAEFGMAFALSHPNAVTTLFGATRTEQLDSAVRALHAVDRIGADVIRAAAEPLWIDRHIVDPAS